jgi:hypothetical protein
LPCGRIWRQQTAQAAAILSFAIPNQKLEFRMARELNVKRTPICESCPSRLGEIRCRSATSMMSFGRHFAVDKLMLLAGPRNFAGATTQLGL